MSEFDDIGKRRKSAVRTAVVMIIIAAAVYGMFVGAAMTR